MLTTWRRVKILRNKTFTRHKVNMLWRLNILRDASRQTRPKIRQERSGYQFWGSPTYRILIRKDDKINEILTCIQQDCEGHHSYLKKDYINILTTTLN